MTKWLRVMEVVVINMFLCGILETKLSRNDHQLEFLPLLFIHGIYVQTVHVDDKIHASASH